MIVKVKDDKNFGKLADDILKKGVNKINYFKWMPLNVKMLIFSKLMEKS
jgi:hypothetical protein